MQTLTETALSKGVVYPDGTPVRIRHGWIIIFHLQCGTLALAEGMTKGYWAKPDSLVGKDDKLLLCPGGFSTDDLPAMVRLAERIAARHGCGVKRVTLPSTTVVAFDLVASAAA
ncbi:hypothetical protein EPO33_00575 [Patescibacteria group bacterium]|nr:MAG: hypothetical protein EPO33_00575 [Patescibacteria group bacterium]